MAVAERSGSQSPVNDWEVDTVLDNGWAVDEGWTPVDDAQAKVDAYKASGGGMWSSVKRGTARLAQGIVGLQATADEVLDDLPLFETTIGWRDKLMGEYAPRKAFEHLQTYIEAQPQHPAMQEAVEAARASPEGIVPTVSAFVKAVNDNPDTAGFVLDQAAELLPQIASFAVGTKGAEKFIPLAWEGTKKGLAAKLAGGGFLSSVANTYGPNMAEAIEKGAGFDQAGAKAALQSVVQGGVDAATAAVIPWKIGPNQFINIPAQTLIQAMGGAAGEIARKGVVGEEADPGEVTAEALLEVLGLPGEALVAFYEGAKEDKAAPPAGPVGPQDEQIDLEPVVGDEAQPTPASEPALPTDDLARLQRVVRGKSTEDDRVWAETQGYGNTLASGVFVPSPLADRRLGELETAETIPVAQPEQNQQVATESETISAGPVANDNSFEQTARELVRRHRERFGTEAIPAPIAPESEANVVAPKQQDVRKSDVISDIPPPLRLKPKPPAPVLRPDQQPDVGGGEFFKNPEQALAEANAIANEKGTQDLGNGLAVSRSAGRSKTGNFGGTSQIFTKKVDGKVVGVLGIYDGRLSVIVDPAHRRKGIATELYDAAAAQGVPIEMLTGQGKTSDRGRALSRAYLARKEEERARFAEETYTDEQTPTPQVVAEEPVAEEVATSPAASEEAAILERFDLGEHTREDLAFLRKHKLVNKAGDRLTRKGQRRLDALMPEPTLDEISTLPDVAPTAKVASGEDLLRDDFEQKTDAEVEAEVAAARKAMGLDEEETKYSRSGTWLDKRKSSRARVLAESYMEEAGLPYTPVHGEWVEVDEERAARIAKAFEDMPHNPQDPEVKAAYDAFAQETKAQFLFLQKSGIKFEPWRGEGQPYANSEETLNDIKENNHLWFFPTDAGFGTGEASNDHPMIQDSGVVLNGEKMSYNDLFRAVHDYFGHGQEGYTFGPRGEENAWRSHSRMYSAIARKAMTTETRGQNSWVNYGPQGVANRANPEKTVYADQKAGLLPEEFGRLDDKTDDQLAAEGEARGVEYSRVFHGSPHRFEKFSLDKIGTGEGAQAYGWGLYFAESPEVAESYKSPLREDMAWKIDGVRYHGITTRNDAGPGNSAANALEKTKGDKEAAIKLLKDYNYPGDRAAIALLKKAKSVEKDNGIIYGTEVPDSAIERMLDWDKPLSEQPESVRAALADAVDEFVANSMHGEDYLDAGKWRRTREVPGAYLYNYLASELGQRGASERLASLGIPGIKYLDQGSRAKGEGTRNFVVFDQKVLDQINETLEAKYSRASDTFYSLALRVVQSLPNTKAGAQQWLATLKNKGVKDEEIEWLGLKEWLESTGRAMSRDEVAEYINANQLQVKVRKFADVTALSSDPAAVELAMEMHEESNPNQEWDDLTDTERLVYWEEAQRQMSGDRTRNGIDGPTRWASHAKYNLPGGTNPVELVFTLPPIWEPTKDTAGWTVVDITESPTLKYTGQRDLEVRDANGNMVMRNYGSRRTDAETLNYAAHEMQGSQRDQIKPYNQDDRNHYGDVDDGTQIFWLRADERIDSDGTKTLLIQENQSARHQAGAAEGYSNEKVMAKFRALDAEVKRLVEEVRVFSESTYKNPKWDALVAQKNEAIKVRNKFAEENTIRGMMGHENQGVPDAPFKTTWHELALKAAVRYAAENGYDRVAWTTGEQQADRYDLSKEIDRLSIKKKEPKNGHGYLVLAGKNGEAVISEQVEDEKGLARLIGKELTQKFLDSGKDADTYTGLQLKVGGTFLKQLYDQKMPQAANKLFKKYGVRAGQTNITQDASAKFVLVEDGQDSEGNVLFAIQAINPGRQSTRVAGKMSASEAEALQSTLRKQAEKNTVHSINITPELKEAALAGLPLFARGQGKPSTVAELRAELKDKFGQDFERLLALGRLELVETPDDIPNGPHPSDTRGAVVDGVSYIVAKNTPVDMARGVVLHEIGTHVGMEEMLGPELWADVLAQFKARLKAGEKAFVDAANMVPSTTRPSNVAEEQLAYLVQTAPKLNIVKRILAAIRAWLYRNGIKIQLTQDDIEALAIAALRLQAEGAQVEIQEDTQYAGKKKVADEVIDILESDQRNHVAGSDLVYYEGDEQKRRKLRGPTLDELFYSPRIRVETDGGQPGHASQTMFARTLKPDPKYTASQTKTAAFKRWFAGSKVVDVTGKPKVVYHGSIDDFDMFEKHVDILPLNKDFDNDAGFFFAGTAWEAAEFTKGRLSTWGQERGNFQRGANLIPVYLAIKNPRVFETQQEFRDYVVEVNDGGEGAQRELKFNGFDGVHIVDSQYGKKGEGGSWWIAFHPEQIKSAIGNRGTFDPSNPDIRYTAEQTNTPAFKKWFKNGVVVNEDGTPKVGYHSTTADITELRTSHSEMGAHIGTREQAESFTGRNGRYDNGRNVLPLYNNLQNPLRLEDKGEWTWRTTLDQLRDQGIITEAEHVEIESRLNAMDVSPPSFRGYTSKAIKEVQSIIEKAGYDGIVYLNRREGLESPPITAVRSVDEVNADTDQEFLEHHPEAQDSYIIFHPEQAKSAIGNKGTFDPTNPDIRYSQGNIPERQKELVDSVWDGQPVDRVFRSFFGLLGGIDEHGRYKPGVVVADYARKTIREAKFSDEGQFAGLNPLLKAARAGLLENIGFDEDFIRTKDDARQEEQRWLIRGLDLLIDLQQHVHDKAEWEVLTKVISQEDVSREDFNKLAQPVRDAILELGEQAVELGLVSQESFERNAGSYLHRVYQIHEQRQAQSGLAKFLENWGAKKRRKLYADGMKGRGKFFEITQNEILGTYPELKDAQKNGRYKMVERMSKASEKAKARVLERKFIKANEAVPNGFEDRGEWEARFVDEDKVTMWRDYTPEERRKMGEILDARYTIAKTFLLWSKDLATGKFYADVAKNPEWFSMARPEGVENSQILRPEGISRALFTGAEWVKVPDISISDTGNKKKFGKMSGGYVRADIWRDINELELMNQPHWWRDLLTEWKLMKTARSPVVHMNNVMSNLLLMDLADVRFTDLISAVRSYKNEDQHYKDARNHGALSSGSAEQELRRNYLDPILKDMEEQFAKDGEGITGRVKGLNKLLAATWDRVKGYDAKMVRLYGIEDEIFRLATYHRRISLGDSPEEAARISREQFIDYNITAPFINSARNSVLPFIGYSYRAIPLVAQNVLHRPWKLAKYATIAYALQALAYGISPGDEDEERRAIREDRDGMTWMGIPMMLRMPFKDKEGNPMFLDVRRWMPAGDVFDLKGGQVAHPMLDWAPVQMGGPLMLGAELALNKQAFNGKEITNKYTDDWMEKSGKVGSYLYRSWMPSAAYVPGSWYWQKSQEAYRGATSATGEVASVPLTAAQALGVKLSVLDTDAALAAKKNGFEYAESQIRRAMNGAKRDLQYSRITPEEYERKVQGYQQDLIDLREKAFKELSGQEPEVTEPKNDQASLLPIEQRRTNRQQRVDEAKKAGQTDTAIMYAQLPLDPPQQTLEAFRKALA